MQKTKNILDILVEKNITTVNAGYRTYQLNIKKGLKDSGVKCYGTCDFDEGVISLEKTMAHETARETLFHELTHLALEICSLGGDEETGIVPSKSNEEITTLISRAFLLLMTLNPELFEVLNEKPISDC